MNLINLVPIIITVIVHLIGIGLFLVWFAIGKPMTKQQFQRQWERIHLVPARIRGWKRHQSR